MPYALIIIIVIGTTLVLEVVLGSSAFSTPSAFNPDLGGEISTEEYERLGQIVEERPDLHAIVLEKLESGCKYGGNVKPMCIQEAELSSIEARYERTVNAPPVADLLQSIRIAQERANHRPPEETILDK